MKSYKEILAQMKYVFFEHIGQGIKDSSAAEAQLKAVAGEIFSLSCYGDYILKQAFLQSATGEYLEKHAALRGITRKSAAAAVGELTFYLDEALSVDVNIPAGTVCSCQDNAYIQFSTDSNAVIKAGGTSATVAATALDVGKEFNAPAGTVTVMVTPPEYVSGVTNDSAFSGGTGDEADSSLRERVLSSYSAPNNCINEKSVRELLLSVEEITDALPHLGDGGELNIYLKTKSGKISEALEETVNDLLGFASICGVQINCVPAEKKSFDAAVLIKESAGYDADAVRAAAEKAVKQFCVAEKIGKSINSAAVAAAVYACGGVSWADIVLQGSASGTVSCGTGEYLALGELTVVTYEQ